MDPACIRRALAPTQSGSLAFWLFWHSVVGFQLLGVQKGYISWDKHFVDSGRKFLHMAFSGWASEIFHPRAPHLFRSGVSEGEPRVLGSAGCGSVGFPGARSFRRPGRARRSWSKGPELPDSPPAPVPVPERCSGTAKEAGGGERLVGVILRIGWSPFGGPPPQKGSSPVGEPPKKRAEEHRGCSALSCHSCEQAMLFQYQHPLSKNMVALVFRRRCG